MKEEKERKEREKKRPQKLKEKEKGKCNFCKVQLLAPKVAKRYFEKNKILCARNMKQKSNARQLHLCCKTLRHYIPPLKNKHRPR